MMDRLEVPCISTVRGIPTSHWGCTFGNFDFSSYPDLFTLSKKFLDRDRYFWLYLWGEPGRGKTHYAVALHRALVAQKGWEGADSSIFIEFKRLIEELKGSLSDYSYEERVNSYCEAECLVLDDIIGKRTDFEVRILEEIVRERHASQRRLVITSNERYESFLGLFGAHEVSRIESVCVAVQLTGLDKRAV